jgi:hypothetical protein
VKLVAPSITAHRTAKAAGIITGTPRPVDADGNTPALWGACVGYETDEPAATADDQDLLVAIDDGERAGKVRAQDRGDKAKLTTRLATERTKAKADRQAGKKPGRPVKADAKPRVRRNR